MTRTKAALAGILTASLLVGAGVGAHAQNRVQNPGRPTLTAQRDIDPAAVKARMDERHAARAAALHDRLGITPAQEGAWAAYQSAIRPPAHDGGRPGRQDLQGLTTPERMDRLVQEANRRHAEVLGRAAAIRQFYGQLSAEQKTIFDAAPHAGPGGPGGRRMGPGPRGGRGFGEGPRGPRPGAVAG